MLEQIKSEVYKTHTKEEKIGMFVSVYDTNNVLLASNGVISTDKPLDQLIDILYHGIIEKYPTSKKIIVDIVQEPTLQKDVALLISLSPGENGIFLLNKDDNKSGIMLPGIPEAKDMKTALNMIKQKFGLGGNVEIYTFKTEKISIS